MNKHYFDEIDFDSDDIDNSMNYPLNAKIKSSGFNNRKREKRFRIYDEEPPEKHKKCHQRHRRIDFETIY